MLTATQALRLYQVLMRHINNEEDAKTIVTEMESSIDNKFVEASNKLATKEDVLNLKLELRTEMKDMKFDLIKWQFTFFATITIMIIGLYMKK